MSVHVRTGFCIAFTVLLILACLAAGCSSSPSSPAPSSSPAAAGGGNAVSIKNFAFSPATLTVKTGTTVTWTNQDSVSHIVVSDTGAPSVFSSDPLSTGASYSFTFTQAGTYPYHCPIHPSMTGTIVVE